MLIYYKYDIIFYVKNYIFVLYTYIFMFVKYKIHNFICFKPVRKEMEEKLKKIRLTLKKTQKEMSSLLGLGEITWQNYERGISKPKLETLEKLGKLGFNINWITSIDDDSNGEVEESLINRLANTSVNKTNVFNTLLNELRLLYENESLEDKPQNYLEDKAFEMAINVSSMAQNDNDAVKMIQLLINQEKESLDK